MSEISSAAKSCRICESENLEQILDFKSMALTGVFLQDGRNVPSEPLVLMRCKDCSLVQLGHSYSLKELYGESYGYESHLNRGMVEHLQRKARILEKKFLRNKVSIIVDIAANDGTFLAGIEGLDHIKVGIDPLINLVSNYFPKNSVKIPEFFTKEIYWDNFDRPCHLVTSMSVLYDLENPQLFVSDIADILDENGIWHFEQSYLPSMVETLSYDTICHEHLLYLSMHNIQRLLANAGLQILDASLNSTNGGSIAVTAIKSKSKVDPPPFVNFLLRKEVSEGYQSGVRMHQFAKEADLHRIELLRLLQELRAQGQQIVALGASTKGNVLLQWLEADESLIQTIGDVNIRKFGRRTPGTNIPIIDEKIIGEEATEKTIALVLPWHFRDGIVSRSELIFSKGGSLLFPLPRIEIVAN